MSIQTTFSIGNSVIMLTDHNGDFSDGCTNGYLTYYDERYRPRFPLTSEIITTFIQTHLSHQDGSASWNAGFIVGWIEALVENHPETFTSRVSGEKLESTAQQHLSMFQ